MHERSKRVKTGCLTCRTRRRKCDEQKPKCANCIGKSLSCRYGPNLTFVPSKLQELIAPGSTRPSSPASPVVPTLQTAISPSGNQHTPTQDDIGFDIDTPGELGNFSAGLEFQLGSTISAHVDSVQSSNNLLVEDPQPRYQPAEHLVPQIDANPHRKKYELELFTYYRYHVAPVLDLGLGSLAYGVGAVLDSIASETIYHAILAVASLHRAVLRSPAQHVDEATGIISSHLAQQSIEASTTRHCLSSKALLLWRTLLSTPVRSWSCVGPSVLEHLNCGVEFLEDWQLLTRLHLATVLADLATAQPVNLTPAPLNTIDGKESEHLKQLSVALWNLEQSVALQNPPSPNSINERFPLAQRWLDRWRKLQNWYHARSDDMQPIVEVREEEMSQFQLKETLIFPCIVFSNACAVVANVVHHVNAVILLRNKPRLTKITGQPKSSTSLLWHANRTVGIISSAADAKTWDPVLIAALVCITRQFSHPEQIRAIQDTMARIQTISGVHVQMKFQDTNDNDNDG
ncbi:hypothetical protein LTR84_000807 [Exophiala bonariae]|uniref:Zn(2)-C6 fungal-type domain-containing protein n=1 Tax=Exophiala bonariae TaxID=1690606 RepID=A0AAV9NV41_9EURO|nr:hypothetical protein LTR84_000807 [Exophiala bonariae]